MFLFEEQLKLDFYKVVKNRRSVRRFKTDSDIKDDVVRKLIETACLAPSAGNYQNWHFIIVEDAQKKRRLAEICTKFSRLAWKDFSKNTAKLVAGRGGTWDKSYMTKLSVLIVVCYETIGKTVQDSNAHASAWCAIENLLLAATAEGLSACVYNLWKREINPMRKLFKIPKNYKIAAIIQAGYPAETPEQPPKKKLEEVTSYDAFSKEL